MPAPTTATQAQSDPSVWSRALAWTNQAGATVESVAQQVRALTGASAAVARGVASRAMDATRAAFSLQHGLADDPVERSRIGLNPNLPAGSAYRTHVIVEYRDSATGRINRVYTVQDWTGNPSYTDIEERLADEQATVQAEAWMKYAADRIPTPTIHTITIHSIERRS